MRAWGIVLLLVGVGSFALPRVGVPMSIRFVPPEYQIHASIAASVLGVILLVLGRKKKEKK